MFLFLPQKNISSEVSGVKTTIRPNLGNFAVFIRLRQIWMMAALYLTIHAVNTLLTSLLDRNK